MMLLDVVHDTLHCIVYCSNSCPGKHLYKRQQHSPHEVRYPPSDSTNSLCHSLWNQNSTRVYKKYQNGHLLLSASENSGETARN